MNDWELQVLDIEMASYTVGEFLEWKEAGRLELSPSFQRGKVWRRPAMAFLIDTILRGYPIPPIHIRFVRRDDGNLIREVIDGQQRLNAIISYFSNDFALTKPRNPSGDLPPWAGLRFYQLDSDLQRRILDYSFRAEVYKGQIRDEVVYEIFSRINIHSIPLSDQELRNGRFFGEFKQSVYRLADEHKPLFLHLSIFTNQSLARMLDSQFVSEALAVQVEGMQDKKSSLDDIYTRYESEWPEREKNEEQFRAIIDLIRTHFADVVKNSRFTRIALFYSLFCVLYHRVYGIEHQKTPTGELPLPYSPRLPLSESAIERLRLTIQNLSDFIEDKAWTSDTEETAPNEDNELESVPGTLESFAKGAAGQTDNLRPRFMRFRSIWEVARLSEQ
ncbi:DUF262 domain-containing protein [Rhodococcus hoagii]|nr:DUF262 domain-containing protein [Prescottella equi]NKS40127.1 DUF262 domain-containing protein [Prescottella equi]ORL39588.1 hypothetical protein A6F59_20050 [Prescottella equi]